MKAIVTSIGESTTELCVWSLRRNGFDVELLQADTTLWHKLKFIYEKLDEDFLRIDADVIVNRNCKPSEFENSLKDTTIWWVQYMTWSWYKQDADFGGIQFIRKQALPAMRANISRFKDAERPESQMYRLAEFNNPRRCVSSHTILGLHGFGQTATDIERVKETKRRRNQYHNYDWTLAERLDELGS